MTRRVSHKISGMLSIYRYELFSSKPSIFFNCKNSQSIGYSTIACVQEFPVGADMDIGASGISGKACRCCTYALKFCQLTRFFITMKCVDGAGHFRYQIEVGTVRKKSNMPWT